MKMNKLNISDESFIHKGMKIWNDLPRDVRDENNETTFKKMVADWIGENIEIKPKEDDENDKDRIKPPS